MPTPSFGGLSRSYSVEANYLGSGNPPSTATTS